MIKKLKCYVAGPFSGDQTKNVSNAVMAAEKIARFGYIPYIPHLTFVWDMLCPHDYDFWMHQDLEWLDVCDVLVRLPGRSPGADMEASYALHNHITVFAGAIEDLPSFIAYNNIENISRKRNEYLHIYKT